MYTNIKKDPAGKITTVRRMLLRQQSQSLKSQQKTKHSHPANPQFDSLIHKAMKNGSFMMTSCHRTPLFFRSQNTQYFVFYSLINVQHSIYLLNTSPALKLRSLCMAFFSGDVQHNDIQVLHKSQCDPPHSHTFMWNRRQCISCCAYFERTARSRSTHCSGVVQTEHPGSHILENQDYTRCHIVKT